MRFADIVWLRWVVDLLLAGGEILSRCHSRYTRRE